MCTTRVTTGRLVVIAPNITIPGSGLSAADLQAAVASGIQSGANEFGKRLLVELRSR